MNSPVIPKLPEETRALVELARQMKCTREKHEGLKSESTWGFMEYVGVQSVCEEYSLELRNCKCGSTLAIRIHPVTKNRI